MLLTVGSTGRSAAQGVIQQQEAGELNDSVPSTPFTLVNTTDDVQDVWLGPACEPGDDSTAEADPLAPWRNQSTCVAAWLTGYPHHFTLPPHAQHTVDIRITPPLTLPDGSYYARLIWATELKGITAAGEKQPMGVQHYEDYILYTKGPPPPHPTRTRWQATLPAGRQVALVSAAPAALVLDDHQRTAALTLSNPGATPLAVWLTVDCPWFRVNFINHPKSHQYEAGWHARIPNAAFWLSGYPRQLVLAPHERRTMTLTAFSELFVRPLRPGSYYARLFYVQAPVLTVTPAGDTSYATPSGSIPVVFHHGPAPLHPTLSQLQRTPRPDRTSQACVTVAQPGLGVVAVLHAVLEDAQGHPVPDHAAGGTVATGGPPWRLDTTVGVWEVEHHRPLNVDRWQDTTVTAPMPVCFSLPALAPGHYQLAVSAVELGDRAGHQPARATLPIMVPQGSDEK